jgi:hypothetical protein
MQTFFNTEELTRYAKQQLEKTDYSVLSDVNLNNKHEFITYRSILRQIIINPNISSFIPNEPKADWIIVTQQANQPQPETDIATE